MTCRAVYITPIISVLAVDIILTIFCVSTRQHIFPAMKPAMISTFFAIICFFIVDFSTPAGSQGLFMKPGSSKTFADRTKRTGLGMANKIKFEVMKITERLLRYRTRISKRLLAKMADQQNGILELFRTVQEERLENLAKIIRAAGKGEPSINTCYKSTEDKMRQQIEDLKRSNCTEIDMEPIDHFILNINESEEWGDIIIDFLDDVIYHCCSTNCARFQQCVNSKSNSVNEHIRLYRHDLRRLQEAGLSFEQNPSFFQCYAQRVGLILQKELAHIFDNGRHCVLTQKTKRSGL